MQKSCDRALDRQGTEDGATEIFWYYELSANNKKYLS